jgi:hypothetical protein
MIPYWASRWICMRCGRYHTGDVFPPQSVGQCPHCKGPSTLENFCPGTTRAALPYFTKPSLKDIGCNFSPIRGGVQSNGKGYKRKAGERSRLNGYHRVLEEGD